MLLKGSKSIINRLLCMSLYHDIELNVENVNYCNDVLEMMDVVQLLQTSLSKEVSFSISEAGTCLRFVLPFLAFSRYDFVTIHLGERLSQRPIMPLINCLNLAGANIVQNGDLIRIKTHDHLSDVFTLENCDSSQYLSSILMFASSQKKEMKIIFKNPQIISYIKMTRDILNLFGYSMISTEKEIIVLPQKVPFKKEIFFICDPDYSTACYLWLYSILVKKEVFIKKIGIIHHPDYYFIDVLKLLGIKFIEKEGFVSVETTETTSLKNDLFVDMSSMPDQIITLAFLALFSGIKIQISGCETLPQKESNRVTGIIENVEILGGKAFFDDGVLNIFPFDKVSLKPILKTFCDHRFALTFIILKQKVPSIEIDSIDSISKSYPGFIDQLSHLFY